MARRVRRFFRFVHDFFKELPVLPKKPTYKKLRLPPELLDMIYERMCELPRIVTIEYDEDLWSVARVRLTLK